MDLIWLVPASAAAAMAVVAVVWFRKRQIKRAHDELQQVHSALPKIEADVQPFVATGGYVPESFRRPLDARLAQIAERTLPAVAKVLRQSDGATREHLGGVLHKVEKLRHTLKEHNDQYVKRMVAEHSKLLVEELRTDEAQREAIVRDDHRNLVIAGAGSGKTRTIVGRIRFLIERDVPPSAILAVTFTNKATEEMQDRLQQMGVPLAAGARVGVTVSTLHALGKRVVQAKVSGPISVADDLWTDSLVAEVLRDARGAHDPRLAHLYLNAILHFHRNEDERAPAVAGDKMYRTLRGEHVRSIGERIIADFLFLHNVSYRYEAKAWWSGVGPGRNAYHPDFTLPDIGASIEYWGINRAGEVAGWMDIGSVEYREGMNWKREQFRQAGKVLLEFYDYERTEGTLEGVLRERIAAAGAVLRPVTFEELQKAFGDMKYIGSAIEKLLVQFITNARSLRRGPTEIRSHLDGATPRVYHFGLLGASVLERYEASLAGEDRIDFSDMLHRASDILERGVNPLPRFEHILVDEFQDTSAAMARILKGLVAVNEARLFAVGDDWQAIYGFAGGDVDHITNFESHFGPASTTMLNINYRSPMVIVEAGAALIAHNEKQVPKQVQVFSQEPGEAYVHEVDDDDVTIVDQTLRLVQDELSRCSPDEVLVLSRTNHILENVTESCRRSGIPVASPERREGGVRIMSVHKAKGLEATVVIVVNASDHLFGFPSKVENQDVIEPVRMSAGNDEAEERRLFYVAITRATKRLHLVARRGLPSPYLAEIEGVAHATKDAEPSGVPMGARFAGVFYVDRLYSLSDRQAGAKIRQAGLLTTATERYAFTSWAPVDLQLGATYLLKGTIKDRPYRDQQRVKLDERTTADLSSPLRNSPKMGAARELRPRPPPSHQPRLVER